MSSVPMTFSYKYFLLLFQATSTSWMEYQEIYLYDNFQGTKVKNEKLQFPLAFAVGSVCWDVTLGTDDNVFPAYNVSWKINRNSRNYHTLCIMCTCHSLCGCKHTAILDLNKWTPKKKKILQMSRISFIERNCCH